MLKNYIKIAFRNIFNQKIFSLINIVGLSIGMAACILILLFIQYELSFEKMHNDRDNIYRVLTIDKAMGTNSQRVGITVPALGPAIPEEFPEVRDVLRMPQNGRTLMVYEDNNPVYAENLRSSDANFFDFFGFDLIHGDPDKALLNPYSIVLTQSLAKTIFGEENPLNKSIKVSGSIDMVVTGIMQDLPKNTHFTFDALQSISTDIAQAKSQQPENSDRPIWLESWQMIALNTYLRFNEGITPVNYDEKLTKLARDNNVGENFDITLQPLNDVHLKSTDVIFDSIPNKSDEKNIYIFGVIAILLLLIASVNYMNLSTAKSIQRAKEVGIRKVVGSARRNLVFQFLGESIIITMIALILSIPIVELLLPQLNNLTSLNLSLNLLTNSMIQFFLISLLVLVGIFSGLYPALVLSSFKPISVLKGSFKSGKKGIVLRKALVVFQFSLSIALIGSTAVVYKQLNYIKSKDIGYDREQVLLFDMNDRAMTADIELFEQGLKDFSGFENVARAGNVPGRTFGRTSIIPEGSEEDDIWIMSRVSYTPEAIDALGMEIVEGENFPEKMSPDNISVIINETAVKQLGWENPLEKRFFRGERDSVGTRIQGVVKDFHFIDMSQNIEPVMIFPMIRYPGNIVIAKISKGRIDEAMDFAKKVWSDIYPDYPFTYSFMDDEFNALYTRDQITSKIVNVFSLLALFIACLGLFGLASYSTTQRKKEIGIRKTMGASTFSIVSLLTFDFLKWVMLANLIAWPLIYWGMNKWLENFAHRTNINLWIMIFSSIIGLFIATITVSSQTINAANSNPVDSLKYE